jgi:hypothetical protein
MNARSGESVAAWPLETITGKTVSEQSASRVNQRLTNALVARDLGLPENAPITAEALKALRKREGEAYEAVNALPGKIRAGDAYKQALAELRAELETPDFPDVEMGKAARNIVKAADQREMTAKGIIEWAKRLRSQANANAKNAADPEKLELARTQRAVAESLEDLLERNVADPALLANCAGPGASSPRATMPSAP